MSWSSRKKKKVHLKNVQNIYTFTYQKALLHTLLLLVFTLGLSPYKTFVFIQLNRSPLKMMEVAFHFMLKAVFVFQIFTFLSWLFVHVEKRHDNKAMFNFKIYGVTDWKISHCNKTMKFGKSTEYNISNIFFLKNHIDYVVERLVSDPLIRNQN